MLLGRELRRGPEESLQALIRAASSTSPSGGSAATSP